MSDSGGPGKPLKAARPWSWRSPALVSVGKDLGAAVLAEKATSSALGATWATRMRTSTLYRVLAALLVLIAVAFLATDLGHRDLLDLSSLGRVVVGVVAGLLIGAVAAVMGVAGGEPLIPTIVLLYGLDIKVAGSLSMAVDARSVRQVRPGRQLRRAPAVRPVRRPHGVRLRCQHRERGTSDGRCSERYDHPAARNFACRQPPRSGATGISDARIVRRGLISVASCRPRVGPSVLSRAIAMRPERRWRAGLRRGSVGSACGSTHLSRAPGGCR